MTQTRVETISTLVHFCVMSFKGVAPLTSLQMFAAQTHEIFSSFVEAGFKEEQALLLVQTMLVIQGGESDNGS